MTRRLPRVWNLEHLSPFAALLPLRLFLGLTYAFAGVEKLATREFLDAGDPRSVVAQLGRASEFSPIARVAEFLLHNNWGRGVGVAVALSEIAVGVALVWGRWVGAAATVGAAPRRDVLPDRLVADTPLLLRQ